MENTENSKISLTHYYISIMITEGICVAILLLSVICMKYFFKSSFVQLKEFYINEICCDTEIDEVLNVRGESV